MKEEYQAEFKRLQLKKFVNASPERVFRAWTDATELQQWWGPKGVRCLSADIDLRVGGRYVIENEFPDGTVLCIAGAFEIVEPPECLVYTWSINPESEKTERVSVRFNAHAKGTEITLLHEQIPNASLRDQHRDGWYGCFDGLQVYLEN